MHKVSIIFTCLGIPRFKSGENRFRSLFFRSSAARTFRRHARLQRARGKCQSCRFPRPSRAVLARHKRAVGRRWRPLVRDFRSPQAPLGASLLGRSSPGSRGRSRIRERRTPPRSAAPAGRSSIG